MSELKYLKLEEIQLGDNVRSKITKESVTSLSQSIQEQGLLQPLLVMKDNDNDKYKLIAGFRRYTAAKLAELDNIPVHVMEIKNIEEVQLVENLQREELNPIDEAKAYQKLLNDHTLDDMTVMVGKGKWYVQQRISLLSLAPKVKDAIAKRVLSSGHGTTIARLKNHKQQIELMNMIISDRMSVKQTESNLDDFMGRLENAIFDKKDCMACTWNGSKHNDLFDAKISLKGHCLNKDCYELKLKTYVTERKAALIKKGVQVIHRDKLYSDERYSKSKQIRDYNIDEIGKDAYKENCLKPCENFAVVLDKDGSEGQYCLNPSCWKKLAKIKYAAERKTIKQGNGESTQETKSPTDDLRRASRVDETQRRFLLNKIRGLINDNLIASVCLEALFAHENGNKETISGFFKKAGICQKTKSNWDFREIINSLYSGLSDKQRKEGILGCVSNRLDVYMTNELVSLGKVMKVSLDQFRVDEEYLYKWTKAGLMKLAKHLGLKPDKDLEKKPKPEMIAWVLKQKPGKSPKELC